MGGGREMVNFYTFKPGGLERDRKQTKHRLQGINVLVSQIQLMGGRWFISGGGHTLIQGRCHNKYMENRLKFGWSHKESKLESVCNEMFLRWASLTLSKLFSRKSRSTLADTTSVRWVKTVLFIEMVYLSSSLLYLPGDHEERYPLCCWTSFWCCLGSRKTASCGWDIICYLRDMRCYFNQLDGLCRSLEIRNS